MRHPKEEGSDVAFILNTLGRLWLCGYDVDWQGFYAREKRHRIPLPTYPFERRRCWIEPDGIPAADFRTALWGPHEQITDSPAPAMASPKGLSEHVKAADDGQEIVQALCGIWKELLGVDHVNPEDNFFDLGGSSMMAANLFARIHRVFGKRLPLATLYEAPRVSELAAVLQRCTTETHWASLVAIQNGGPRPPLYLVHGAGGNILIYRPLAHHLGADQPVYGLQSPGLDGNEPFLTRVEDMASRYLKEIRAAQPSGPYLLGGYCLGAVVALEMAQQLRKQGEDVPLVALLETYNYFNIGRMSPLANARHYSEKVYFHLRNLLLLGAQQKLTFLKEKGKVARGRTRVWLGGPISYVHQKFKWEKTEASFLSDIWKVNDRAAMEYEPRPYAGRAALFLAAKEYAHHLRPGVDISPMITGEYETYRLPVYPAGMMVDPFVQMLGDRLRECITSALRAPSQSRDLA